MDDLDRGGLDDTFLRVFRRRPEFRAYAPGRVNLIGEHTDYTGGLVLPAAVARHVTVAAAPADSEMIRLYSAAYESLVEFPVAAPAAAALPDWARYAQGVAAGLAAHGIALRGLDAAVGGDLPIGAGLSSSAALEAAAALIFEHGAGRHLSPRDRALICHDAEVSFVGVPCGIMDQFACVLARAGHALFLDCRSLNTHHIPLPRALVIAVCDTGVHRALQRSAYSARYDECAAALQWLQGRGETISLLRDLTVEDLVRTKEMPEPLARRVRHVVTENDRVVQTARALEGGDLDALREIFATSHRSLRDDYEVGAPELDAMAEAALDAPGCLAARMTGAGFGGAVVALVRREDAAAFLRGVEDRCRARGLQPGALFSSEAVSGAREIAHVVRECGTA
jgi:galactokinase